MKTIKTVALVATLMAPVLVAPAAIAQKKTAAAAATSAAPSAIAVVDVNEAVRRSTAYTNAVASIKVSYKPVLDNFQARDKVLAAEIKPMATAFEAASKVPNANRATLQTQLTALQKKQADSETELNTLYRPVALAEAYVKEQIAEKIDAALNAAMAARGVQMALTPEAVIRWMPAVDITMDVVGQLNVALPAVSITPPPGWVPGQKQAAAAAAAAAAQGQPVQQPQPQPQGR